MSYLEFKVNIKKENNKNFNFVKIKALHDCKHCGKLIPLGTECLTVNKKYSTRCWYCDDCALLKYNIMQAKMLLNSVSFGDEGGYMAYIKGLDEAEAEYEDVRNLYNN